MLTLLPAFPALISAVWGWKCSVFLTIHRSWLRDLFLSKSPLWSTQCRAADPDTIASSSSSNPFFTCIQTVYTQWFQPPASPLSDLSLSESWIHCRVLYGSFFFWFSLKKRELPVPYSLFWEKTNCCKSLRRLISIVGLPQPHRR